MRGKIIQYNGADGSGTVVADGKQYRFALDAWRGEHAPAINKTVEVALEGDAITAVTAVGDDVLLKEKAAELGGKLGSLLNKAPASVPASGGVDGGAISGNAIASGAAASGGAITANAVIQRYGKVTLAAYVLFLIGTLVFNAISISMGLVNMGKSLFDIASAMSQFGAGGGGMIKLLLLLGYASIAVPLFWRDRRAWLALVVPLLAVLWAIFSALHAIDSVGAGSGMGGEMSSMIRSQMSDMISIGFGFYLSLAAALVLAGCGVMRFLRAA